MSDPEPFLTPSLHAGRAHWLFAHTELSQSRARRQRFPGEQGEHEPPQSTSVSSPPTVLSLQVGGRVVPSSMARSVGTPVSPQPAIARVIRHHAPFISSPITNRLILHAVLQRYS